MTVAERVIARLAERGVEAAFGIPGKQTLPLNEALADREIDFVVARHETAVSHAAWGYAETSGRLAAGIVVPGPGDMNAMNGLKNAYNDCTPLLHLAVETDPDVRGGDGIHETPPDTYDNVVKENLTVATPQGAVAAVDEAVRTARTDPKGPVRVGIPKGFLGLDAPQAAVADRDPSSPPAPAPDALDRAADCLAAADRPVVVAGGGIRAAAATDQLRAVAERLAAPVVTTYKGKGVLPEEHPLSAGVLCGGASPELAALLADADAALAVGTDFDAVATGGWRFDLPEALVHVTLDPDDAGQGYEPRIALLADAAATLDALEGRLPARERGADRAAAVREADAERIAAVGDGDPPLTSPEALAAVRKGCRRDTVVSADAGGFRIWALVSHPAAGPRRYVNPGSWATMGTGLPAAIGAATADREREVVALTGDGGLLMCLHELHTLAAEDLDVTVVVFANRDYAIISEEAARSYGLEGYGWGDTPIDFVAVAEGLGLSATRAEAAAEITAAVETARTGDNPALVEVPTDPEEPQASEWMSRPVEEL
jgi:acetolactate synthase-1/2/3 large subunit